VNTRKKLILALSSALAFVGLLGCGTSNHLQTITLSTSATGGFFNIKGEGGTLQLVATGNYGSSKTHDLTHVATYTMTPVGDSNDGGRPTQVFTPLPDPPQTATINATGLVTAVPPFACTWIDGEADPTQNKPSWLLTGSYQVIATFQGITSQPVYIGVGSAAGNGPFGGCGP